MLKKILIILSLINLVGCLGEVPVTSDYRIDTIKEYYDTLYPNVSFVRAKIYRDSAIIYINVPNLMMNFDLDVNKAMFCPLDNGDITNITTYTKDKYVQLIYENQNGYFIGCRSTNDNKI